MIRIEGDGVAARVCAHLLHRAQIEVHHRASGAPRVPALVVPASTARLYRDVTGREVAVAALISRRMVKWGVREPVVLPHSAMVVSEADLLLPVTPRDDSPPAWTVFCSRHEHGVQHLFGAREAWVVPVEQRSAETCWAESLSEGWLFAFPGWLISVGQPPEEGLGQSVLIAPEVRCTRGPAVVFSCAPSCTLPLGVTGWLAAGAAALCFDPLCGDGTGHAIREAVLASAVIRAALDGEDAAAVVAHYQARLWGGFRRHLADCARLYESGGDGPWWREQRAAIERGLASACVPESPSRYRLSGLDLLRA